MDARLADAHRLGEVGVAEPGKAAPPDQGLGLTQQLGAGVSHRSDMVSLGSRERVTARRPFPNMPLDRPKIYLLNGRQ